MSGPCALVRWRRVLDTEAIFKSVKVLLKDAEVVTAASHHPCRAPKPIDDKALDAVLFPPINQWGHLPLTIRPMSPHSTSRLARQADTGLAHHKALQVDDFVAARDTPDQIATEPAPAAAPPAWDWDAANQKKKQAIAEMATLTQTMGDIDARINALFERTRNLELD